MLVSILLCLVIVLALVLHSTKTIAAPAAMLTACWALLLAFFILFGQPYTYTPEAIFVAIGLVMSFNLGCFGASLAGQSRRARQLRPVAHPHVPRIPSWLVLVCAVGGVLGAAVVSRSLGHSLLSFSSVSDLFSASQSNAALIFSGENNIPSLGKIGFASLQLGFLLSGARFMWSARRRQVVEWVPLLVAALLWSVVTTQRSYLLVPGVWWVSGMFAAAVYARKDLRLLRPRTILLGAAGALVLAGVVLGLRLVRTGHPASAGGGFLNSSRPWLAGYLPAFSGTLAQGPPDQQSGSVWSGLFVGIKALGSPASAKVGGGYESIGNGDLSNAPTALPFFVAGGIAAAVVVLIVLGYLSHRAYLRAKRGSGAAALGYGVALAGIIWSPNSWFYGYGGRIITVGAAAALLLLAAVARSRRATGTRAARHGSGGDEGHQDAERAVLVS